jgi:hypothetical protein
MTEEVITRVRFVLALTRETVAFTLATRPDLAKAVEAVLAAADCVEDAGNAWLGAAVDRLISRTAELGALAEGHEDVLDRLIAAARRASDDRGLTGWFTRLKVAA